MSKKNIYRMGLDIGSTTIKLVLLDDDKLIYNEYRRHHSDIQGELAKAFQDIYQKFPLADVQVNMTGSGGLSVARWLGLGFVQEVIAETEAINQYIPDADIIIELGGEDAKITYLHPTPEQRMNGTCAGGTGAFIDQMAALLQTDTMGLNKLASNYKTLYPIASRCGVFAKSDMQPLMNDGAAREDLAASVLQAVVNQTISGLACGRPLKGHIIFLGGPLYFLSELRKAYERTLAAQVDKFTIPENAEVYVAIGSALLAETEPVISLEEILERFSVSQKMEMEITRMPKLFLNQEEKTAFYERHNQATAKRENILDATGACYLGIDAGSTTTKAVLCNEAGAIIYSYYASNKGNPVASAITILKDIYKQLPNEAHIANGCVTGYGENLIKAALGIGEGEIETMAHYKAAEFFSPGVDFIFDIGGQDMKCMHVKNGVIDRIHVNEACSAGCGSFIQTFAEGLDMNVREFSLEALQANNPVDLGTRCTVFMNSRVKQAQKEGASVGDISSGLSYSVVRNALYKVIKIRDPQELGKKIVVQGGTFLNDAILRCFELVSQREVIRPDIAGLMGAFGSAIIAKERYNENVKSRLLNFEALERFKQNTAITRCELCPNSCQLTISEFSNGERYVSGNRCERGAGVEIKTSDKLPNLFDYKYKRLFQYKSLAKKDAPLGEIGVPRVLNMYENYPFWHTLLTHLGFRVRISAKSSHKIFAKGMDSISSESVCYPAKLAHGHIEDLIEKGLKVIFYPAISFEQKEVKQADNHFNCPIVTSYPEVIKNNVESLQENKIKFISPFLNLANKPKMVEIIYQVFNEFGITQKQAKKAVIEAYKEDERFRQDVRNKGEETVQWLKENNKHGIVLAGRPYHCDPEIHHGVPEMINTLGMAVLTEDSVLHPDMIQRPIRVVDQWAYHSRLYEAANYVGVEDCLDLIQLNSFGCGLDAITTDQVQEILETKGKIYTTLKIDEVSNLGAAKIRIRSLKVALEERIKNGVQVEKEVYTFPRVEFTKDMKKTHTILAPQMAPIQFSLVESALRTSGHRIKILKQATPEDVEVGLKYVNNDACYPTIMVVGQLVNALLSGKYDPDNTSLAITQTGGGCRATNYVAFLRKALKDAGLPQVPVIALSVQGIEANAGFKFTMPMLNKVIQAIILGDMMQAMLLRVRPYEAEKGAANRLYHRWDKLCKEFIERKGYVAEFGSKLNVKHLIKRCVAEFDALPLLDVPRKPVVGIVGEILVKFHPDANNNVIGVVESEGCEASMPGLLDFFLYCFHGGIWQSENIGGASKLMAIICKTGIHLLEFFRRHVAKAFAATNGKFTSSESIFKIANGASKVLSLGNSSGEGWFLTGEMIELIETGAPNIICAQPFACLPNHVTGKGMIKELRRQYPESNIVAVDYDPGASEVNQLNRIKLMISTAFKKQKVEKRVEIRSKRYYEESLEVLAPTKIRTKN